MQSIGELLRKSIVSVQEGARLGKLSGVELDTQEARVRYLRFHPERERAERVIPWESVRAIGSDAITVESDTAAADQVAAVDRDRVTSHVGDRPVVTEDGERLGHIVNYDIEEITGRVALYHVGTGGLFGRLFGNEITFPPAAVRAFGRDAVVVENAVPRAKAA